jgi:tetratricopeptide (TPR) repeat protein
MRRPLSLVLVLLCAPMALPAQSAPDAIARGDAARDRFQPEAALVAYEEALAADSLDYEANWKAALTLVDLGARTPDSVPDAARDQQYQRAAVLARRATEINPKGADGYFVLSNAVGRAALTKSRKERVRAANAIYDYSTTALGVDPRHDGAYHVLGRWNAEIMRLSSVERLFAKSFMGGKRFNAASWDEAVKYLERSVELRPNYVYHRLDLAKVYIDRNRYAEARAQLEKIPTLPRLDVNDTMYVRDARQTLAAIAGK